MQPVHWNSHLVCADGCQIPIWQEGWGYPSNGFPGCAYANLETICLLSLISCKEDFMASTVWRGYITFGVISIPVRLFRAARAERVSLRRLHRQEPPPGFDELSEEHSRFGPASTAPGGASRQSEPRLTLVSKSTASDATPAPVLTPVKQASVSDESDEIVPAESVVKGFEFEKDRFVEIDAEELKNATAQTSTEMQIEEFVKLADIDPVYFETSYYVSPEAAGEKAYALLYRSMQLTGLVAIAEFAMHGREHVVVLRPGKAGMLAHTMFFATEVRSNEEHRADTKAVSEKELTLAQTLIDSLAAPFEPVKYRDTYREKLEALIAAKVEGQAAASPVVNTRSRARVADLTEALNQSLTNLRKPAGSEQERKPEETASKKTKRASRSAGS
jgi:DNA end-binding protein Ku